MKIQKRIANSTDVLPVQESLNGCKYQEAIDLIETEAASLAECAKTGDEIARDSIVNLSVVLLDLKGDGSCE